MLSIALTNSSYLRRVGNLIIRTLIVVNVTSLVSPLFLLILLIPRFFLGGNDAAAVAAADDDDATLPQREINTANRNVK